MLSLIPFLGLALFFSTSQTSPAAYRFPKTLTVPQSTLPPSQSNTAVALGTPTPTTTPPPVLHRFRRDYTSVPNDIIPKGAVVIGALPGPYCITKSGINVQSRSRMVEPGLQWVPGLPWFEPGQVVYLWTDTNDVKFENVSFSNAPAALDSFTTLLSAYSNSSGWIMTMPASVDVSVPAPTISFTATGPSSLTAYDLQMTVLWDCASDKYAPLSTSSEPPELPMVNPFLNLRAINNCSFNATTTATLIQTMDVRTGEIIVPGYKGKDDGDFWNETDALWTFTAGNNSKDVIFEFPKYMFGGDDPSLIFAMAPSSTAFNLTVPYFTGTPTGWAFLFTATTASSATFVESFKITASAEINCFNDLYANGIYQGQNPCIYNDPLYITDVDNWIYREVDYSLSNYWFNGPTRTTPHGPNVPAATTDGTDGLPKQLIWHAMNVQVDCSLKGECVKPGEIDFCQADINPYMPIWAYLAITGIANMHTQMKNLYDQLTIAALEVGDWGLTFVNEFTDDVDKNAMLTASQVALAATGMVVAVLAAFIPMVNVAKVEANVIAVEAKAANAVGKTNPGRVNYWPWPRNPKAPASNADPESDVPPQTGSDVGTFMSGARDDLANPPPPPANPKPVDFAYADGHPLRAPKQIQPASEGSRQSKAPDIGRRETQVLLGTIPGSILTSAQTLWAKYDPNSVDTAQQGGLWQSFVGNITADMQAQLELTVDKMMLDPQMADVLMTYLWGGTYISGNYSLSVLQWYLRTDLAARAVNNVWTSYHVYVAFTDLGDPKYGNSTPACDAHKTGPQVTKFCGCGGAFYLYNLSMDDYKKGSWKPPGRQDGATDTSQSPFPGQIMPYGLDKFETSGRLNLTGNSPTEGSARAWNATGSNNLTQPQSNDLNNNVGGLFAVASLDSISSVVGRLPGEWALPVCDQGKNFWGGDYMAYDEHIAIGSLPCACGYQGNATADFFAAINLDGDDLYYLAFFCCEGSLLFPEKSHSQVTNNQYTGPGASGLPGGVWPDDQPLYYGSSRGKDIHCHAGGKLDPDDL